MDASDPKILSSQIKDSEIKLQVSKEHHLNWLEGIQNKTPVLSPVEIAHRVCSICLISHIAMKLSGKLKWDPKAERFINNEKANTMLGRSQRVPYGTNQFKNR